MIDSLLRVVEKAIELVNVRQRNNKDYFDLVVHPLFTEFEKVASSYFSLFSSYGIDASEATEIRNGYLQSRIKVAELASKFAAQSSAEDLVEFFNSISSFFYGNFVVPECRRFSDGRNYIDILTGDKSFSSFDQKPASLLEAQASLERKWQTTVALYGDLKLKYQIPIGYKA